MQHDLASRVTLRHTAMATDFWITMDHDDGVYARQAAAAAFAELDRVESLLSRFVENSDVARLNGLAPGRSAVIAPVTFDCLHMALSIERRTAGAFDIAYATRPHVAASRAIELDADRPVVHMRAPGVTLDLGGIGKGFALDQMAKLLAEWDVRRVLLRASNSTLLARQPPHDARGWRATFGSPHQRHMILLKGAALSGSGIDVKGLHIMNPHSGAPARQHRTTWAGARRATEADALSTAFMVMNQQQIVDFCRRQPRTLACVLDAGADNPRMIHWGEFHERER